MLFDNIDEAISAIEMMSASLGVPRYYRGQHHDWPVASSLHRINSDKNPRMEEIKSTVSFIEWLKTRNSSLHIMDESAWEELGLPYYAIAQHYGYKTNFIDFTTDIHIAKGFALIGKKTEENGCIMCLWDNDIRIISDIYRFYSDNFQLECNTLLSSVNYNPFFDFNLSGVSRIKNQKGVFMWDINGIATQLFSGLIDKYFPGWIKTHTFRFKQTDISIEKETVRRIYPIANITEIEIDKYQQFLNREFYYGNNTIPEFPPINCDFSKYFEENNWDLNEQLFVSNTKAFFPSDDQKSVVDILDTDTLTKLLTDHDYCLKFSLNWCQMLYNNNYTIYASADNSSLKLFAEVINEIISTLSLYQGLNSQIIGTVLFQSLRLLYELLTMCKRENPYLFGLAMQELSKYEYNLNDPNSKLENVLDLLRSSVPLDEVVKEAWHQSFVFIKLRSKTDNTSVCVLSKNIINDCTSEYKKEHLRVLNNLYNRAMIPPIVLVSDEKNNVNRVKINKEDIRWELMLNLVPNPTILFEQTDFYRSFLFHIIPWQFIMCPKRNRIYSPHEIKTIRRLDADNFRTGHIFYMGGTYYTIQ